MSLQPVILIRQGQCLMSVSFIFDISVIDILRSREIRETIHSSLRRVHSKSLRTGSYSFRVSSNPPDEERGGRPVSSVCRTRSLNVGHLGPRPQYQPSLGRRREHWESETNTRSRPLMGTLSLTLMAGSPNR